jgi:hypothetical protein
VVDIVRELSNMRGTVVAAAKHQGHNGYLQDG